MAVASGLLVAPTLAAATPAVPRTEPSITSVQRQLGQLALKNSQLVEQFDHGRVMVGKRQRAAQLAERIQRGLEVRYEQAGVEFARNVQAQYQTGSLGAAGALLDSSSGGNYVDRLTTLDLISQHDADVVREVAQSRDAAKAQAARTRTLLTQAKEQRDQVVTKRHAVVKQIARYRALLSRLNSAQQAAYQRASNPSVSSTHYGDLPSAGSAAAQRAVQFALDQVGEPYVFGAAGPDAWDCSGLTMGAWLAGGVSLPHSAADQYNYGTHVDRSRLAPGDLVFFYSPIGHVAIYIGDCMMGVGADRGSERVRGPARCVQQRLRRCHPPVIPATHFSTRLCSTADRDRSTLRRRAALARSVAAVSFAAPRRRYRRRGGVVDRLYVNRRVGRYGVAAGDLSAPVTPRRRGAIR